MKRIHIELTAEGMIHADPLALFAVNSAAVGDSGVPIGRA